MPGAQPRRAPVARVASTARRGANVPAGVPGVYRVPRVRVVTIQAVDLGSPGVVSGWLQGPDFEITYPLVVSEGWQYATNDPLPGDDEQMADDLRLGFPLTGDPDLGGLGDPHMLVQYDTGTGLAFITVQSTIGQMSGDTLTDLANAETDGAYVPPTPPPGTTLEYENVAGLVVSDVVLAGDVSAGGGTPYSPGGHAYWTTENAVSEFRAVAHMQTDYELLASWPEQTATANEWSLALVDVYGDTRIEQETRTLWLHVVSDSIADPGSMARDGSPPAAEATIADLTVTVTIRPPRHRFVSAGSTWLASTDWNAYVWDAGLFLGTDWADVTGLPTVTPSGCSQLNFYVAPAASDVFTDDQLEPFGRFYRNSDTSNGEIIAPDPGTPPDAGSHIWVIWFGPTSNVGVDPEPGVDPASLIAASLAENGTA